jgi:chorismate mutase/prephenate dehydratase
MSTFSLILAPPESITSTPHNPTIECAMSGTTGALAELRREIDEIDQALHDLLMRRAAIVEEVAATKAQNANVDESPQIIYPAREAEVIRRLSGRHRGRLPKATLVQIWREIISASVRLQRPMRVGMVAPTASDLTRLARDHFGTLIGLQSFDSAAALFDAVAADADLVGVLPFPEPASSEQPWWHHLASGVEQAPRVVTRLPFLKGGAGDAFVIGTFDPGDSSADVSLLVVESSASLASDVGDGVRILAQGGVGSEPHHRSLSLVEVDGDGDAAFAAVAAPIQALDDETTEVRYVGGYAVQVVE